jgi:diguanylate cyclase (GGDEF)-like protein
VTIALVAVVASLGTLAIVALALLAQRRAPARDDERVARSLAELGASIDLDEVLSRTLEAATAVEGADAALVSIGGADDKPVVVTRGLSADEAEREALAGPTDRAEGRALTVPLASEEGPIGFLTVFSRTPGRLLGAEARAELERLALRAGPALDNARRFREARQLADLDALTNLHNRRYFHETLAREVARARRYDRHLALIVLDLDDFKAVNDRIGHLAGDSVLADAAERVRDVVRSADVACRVGGDEFAVILPESTLEDADQLYRRIQAAVVARPIARVDRLDLSAGAAELRPEDDAVSFFQRADEALYRAKGAGKGQVVAAG